MTGRAGHGDALAAARRVADAVLYEGYVLFPYHASAAKNRYRWQFGVLVPQAQTAAGSSEPSEIHSQCLLRAGPDTTVEVIVRFLGVRRRQVAAVGADGAQHLVDQLDVDGQLLTSWDEGVECEVATGAVPVSDLLAATRTVDLSIAASHHVEDAVTRTAELAGRVARVTEPVSAVAEISAETMAADVVRLTAVVRNDTPWASPGASRDEVMRRSLAGVHLLLMTSAGAFSSVTDPAPWATPWVGELTNRHTHPVLVGSADRDDLLLSTPIILPDHPRVAPESTGEAFDATEIDELLTLSVQAMTAEEKRQARATDPRAADVVDRADALPPAWMERLHGAIRQLDPPHRSPGDDAAHAAELERDLQEFLGVNDAPVEEVAIDGDVVRLGATVRLRPSRRADAQDLFAAGRLATVERIERDLEGAVYIAVTLDDDPAAEVHEWARRFLYFHPEEIELVRPAAGPAAEP